MKEKIIEAIFGMVVISMGIVIVALSISHDESLARLAQYAFVAFLLALMAIVCISPIISRWWKD